MQQLKSKGASPPIGNKHHETPAKENARLRS